MAKTHSVVRLTTHKLSGSVGAVVGVELLATTLAGKHIATVLPNFVLAWHLQRLENFVTDSTGMHPLSLLCFLPPTLIQNNFPHKPTLDTCRPSCQQINTPIHVLLKADPCLEDVVADDKADPLVCLQSNQISVFQYFSETAYSMDHQHVVRHAVIFLKKFLPQ